MEKSFPIFITELELEIIIWYTPNTILKDLFFNAVYTRMQLGELLREYDK